MKYGMFKIDFDKIRMEATNTPAYFDITLDWGGNGRY
jgi:hypothetical protein